MSSDQANSILFQQFKHLCGEQNNQPTASSSYFNAPGQKNVKKSTFPSCLLITTTEDSHGDEIKDSARFVLCRHLLQTLLIFGMEITETAGEVFIY